jgi:hypothetical protein
MILDVPRLRVQFGEQMSLGIDPRHDERLVPRKVVVFKIQVVVNQRGLQIGVVTDSIAADPGIHKRKGQKEQEEQQLCMARGCHGD